MSIIWKRINDRLEDDEVEKQSIAKKIGTSPSNLAKMLHGRTESTSLRWIEKIAEAMDMDVAELLRDRRADPEFDPRIARAQRDFAEAARHDPRVLDMVENVVKNFQPR